MVTIVLSANSELMMTMEVLIYPALALMVLLLIYAMFGPREHLERSVTHNLNINVDKCASEDCIRCSKYKAIIKKVTGRYDKEPAVKTEAVTCGERMCQAITSLDPNREYQLCDEQQPNVLLVDGLSAKAFWPEDEFVSDITILESHTREIIKEFENVYNNEWPNGWLINSTSSGEWAVFHLINQGSHIKPNCDKCPKTYETVKKLVCSMSGSGNLFANVSFSVVQSGTHISPHYGPTNIRIRCHLGLKISNPQSSYLTVNGKRGTWETGKCLIFDDSFLHEVKHADIENEARAVLLIDMWHPELTQPERDLIDNLFKFQKTSFPLVRTIPLPLPLSDDL